jgi:lysozyme family protein
MKKTKWGRLLSASLFASSFVTFAPILDQAINAETTIMLPSPSSDDWAVTAVPMDQPTDGPVNVIDITPREKQAAKRYSVYQIQGNKQILLNTLENLNEAIQLAKGMFNTKVIDEVSHKVLWNNSVLLGTAPIKSFIPAPKPSANIFFDNALTFVLSWEGGYSNHPNDHGGATNQGITQREYDYYRTVKGLLPQDVRKITNEEVREIYYNSYWLPVHGNDLSFPLALALFDTGVNCGPGTAIAFLERSLGLPQDGGWGQGVGNVLATKTSTADIALQMMDYRHDYYKYIADNDATQMVFLQGWFNRNDALRNLLSQWIQRNHLYLDQAKWYIQKKNTYNAAYYTAQSVKNGILQVKDAVSLGDTLILNDRTDFYHSLVSAYPTNPMKAEVKIRFLDLAKSCLAKNDYDHAADFAMQAYYLGATSGETIGIADSYTKKVQSKYWMFLVQTGEDSPAIDAELMKRQSVAVTGVSLDNPDFSMKVGDHPIKLNALITPSNATNQKVNWKAENNAVVQVDANGVVKPIGAGTTTITVSTESSGKKAACKVTVVAANPTNGPIQQ